MSLPDMNQHTDATQVDFVQLFKRESKNEQRFAKKYWMDNDKKSQQRAAEWMAEGINRFLSLPLIPEDQWAELYLRKTLYARLVMFRKYVQDELMKDLEALKNEDKIDVRSFRNISRFIQIEREVFQRDKKRLRKELEILRGKNIIELWRNDRTETKDSVVEFYRENHCKIAVFFPLIVELRKEEEVGRVLVSVGKVFDEAGIFTVDSLKRSYYRWLETKGYRRQG
jgi:hypothetical protein